MISEQYKINQLISRRDNIKNINNSLSNRNTNLKNERGSLQKGYDSRIGQLRDVDNPTLRGNIKSQEETAEKNIGIILNYDISLNYSKNKINYLKKDILYNTLFDINTQKNIYYSIKSENDIITNNTSKMNESITKNGEKYKYTIQQLDELVNINTVFFSIYYFLFILLCYILFYKNISRKLKFLVFLFFLLYPFIVYVLEAVIYSFFNTIYLSLFPIDNFDK
jgi:hypothetical protein